MPKLLSPEEFDREFGGGFRAEAPKADLWTLAGSGLDRAQGQLYDVAEQLGLPTGDLRRQNEAESERSMQRFYQDNLEQPRSWRDVDGVVSGLRFIRNEAIKSAPELVTSLGAGGVGAAYRLGTLGRLGLAGAANYPLAVGDVLSNQRDESGTTNIGSAAILGVPYVAADMVGLDAALASGKLMRTGIRRLDDMQGIRGGLARTGANMALNAPLEGLSETGQEVINQFGRMGVNPSQTLFNQEANERYLDSFIGGAALGGAASGALGGWRRSADYQAPIPTVDQGQFDLTQRQAPAGQAPQYNLTTQMDPIQGRIDRAFGLQRTAPKGYEQQFLEAFNAPSGFRVADPVTGVERELTAGEYQQMQLGDLLPPAENTVASTQQAGKTPTVSQFDEVDQGLTDIGIPLASGKKTREKQRAFYADAVATGIPLDSDLLTPYWTAVAENRFGDRTKVLLQNAIVQAKKDAANVSQPSAPVAAAPASGSGRSAAPVGSVGNSGPVSTVANGAGRNAGDTQPAGGQAAPVANTGVQRTAAVAPAAAPVGENTSILAGANPAAAPAAVPAPALVAAPVAASAAPDPFQVSDAPNLDYDEDQNRLEIARLTGQGGVADTLEQEALGQRADRETATSDDAERILAKKFEGSPTAERDRQIFDAWLTATRPAGKGVKGKINNAISKDFGIGVKTVEAVTNLAKLVETGKSLGYSEEQVYEAFGLEMGNAKAVDPKANANPEAAALKRAIEELGKRIETAKGGQKIELEAQRKELRDVLAGMKESASEQERGQIADALRAAGFTVDENDSGGWRMDDSREWQKESSSGNQEGDVLLRFGKQIDDLRSAIESLETQGLENAAAELEELTLKVATELEAAKAALQAATAPAAPKREVSADLAAAKQKFKDVGRDVTKMEPEELRMLRGEAERFKNRELLAKIDAQLGAAPAAETQAEAAPAAEETAPASKAPVQDSGQTLWESLRAQKADLVAYDELTANERGYLTELADRTNGKPKLKDELGLQELMGRTTDMKFGKTVDDVKPVKAKNPYTAKELLAEIKNFVRADIPGRKLLVVDSVEDLLRSPDKRLRAVGAALAIEGAYGVATDGRAFLVANRIEKGSGRAKFMHEVGAHLGLEKLLPKAVYDKLTQQITEWAKKDDGSLESELALNAAERVQNAGTKKEDRRAELLAYFIEEAMEAGIDPTADVKNSGPLRDWFRTLWAAFKIAVRKLGFKPEALNAQDVVNLAFGAARLEIAGTWHGTAASFRNFRNKYIGSGEGATAYGWGTYLAQRTGIAKGYWEADVARKSSVRAPKGLSSEELTLFQKIRKDGFRSTTDWWALNEAGLSDDYSDQERGLFPELYEKVRADGKIEKPEGNLMRVDTAVDDEQVYDYDKPLSKQPPAVQDALYDVLEPLADEIVDRTNRDIPELTGRDIFGTGENDLGLLSNLIMDDAISLEPGQDAQFDRAVQQGKFHEAASHFLRTLGIQGIKFFDAKSRGTATQAISYNGRSWNRDDLRDAARDARNMDAPENVRIAFGVLRDVLRNGLAETREALEAKVAEYEQMYFNTAMQSAARYNVKVDKDQELADAKAKVQRDVYQAKQLAWLNANESNFSLVQLPKTRNLIVFDDRDIFRVGAEEAADPQRMRFGKNTPGTGEVFRQTLDAVPNQFRGPVKDVLTAVKDMSAKGLDYVIFTNDLIGRAVDAGVKSAKTFQDLLIARGSEVRKLEREVERIADMYALVPEKDRDGERSVNNFLFESTRQGKWGYPNGKMKADPEMAAWFNSLDGKTQDFVKAVFKHGDDVLAKKKATVLKYTETEYDSRIASETDPAKKAELEADKKNSLKRFQSLFAMREGLPYAPIKRTGDYVVVAKSADYLAAEKSDDKKLMAQLEKDEDHYQVSFTNTKWEARQMANRLAADGRYDNSGEGVYLRERDKHQDYLFGGDGVMKSLSKLRTRLENSDDKASGKMLRMVSDLYLEALAENSARKSEMRRRGIAGDVDMIASFAQQGKADANFMASVQYGQRIQDAMQSMTDEAHKARDDGRASEIRNELVQRYAQSLDRPETPWLNRLTRLSSIYYLAMSPAYYMQNLTQPWMMSLPAMTGRHEWARANQALFKAYGELKGVVTSGKLLKQNFDLSKVPGDVRDAIQELANRGKIDIGLDTEMGEFSAQGKGKVSGTINKIDKGLRLAVQKVETINRLSTAMAAYRLEMAKTGDAKKAIDYADRILTETHGDYTGMNAPRVFNTPVGKVALQFRKFQLIQLSYYAKLVNDIFTNPKERMAALKMLGYSLGHTALFAGVRGLPGFAALAWVAGKLLGDDDEPYDLEAEMRKAIGDTELANLILRGAPTLAGLDISGKVGAGNMLSILPFSNADLTTQQGRFQAVGELILGASGGMVSRVADGLGLLFSGDMMRGLEMTLPKGLGDVLKAYREGSEGMTRRNGDLMLSKDEISFAESLMTGLGFSSVQKSVVYEQQQRVRNMDQNFQDRTTEVKNQYAKAVREKDTEAMAEARQAWAKLQEARVRNGYTKQPLSNLLKAPQEQAKREKNTLNGVQFNKQNAKFVASQV